MRLLKAKTLKLHSFQEAEAPRYAILSHTWHDDEVLFEDLQDISRASKKAGFEKIKYCCLQALKEDIEFVWVDTCCIDKTSSAELSEAINSMYRWYQKARICYAYLRDVSIPADGEVDIGGSLWFKRAWTLQELLAPKQLVFFSRYWIVVGSKDEKITTISEATGIDEDYLIHGQLKTASIAKRMSWAANRQATRAEDVAYSLFGIFDVQMPLLYGEGLPKAFRRLQEEIMKYSDDHTLFAWGERFTKRNQLSMYWDESRKTRMLDKLKSRSLIDGFNNSQHVPENCGVLAQSPADFIQARNLAPSTFKTGLATPYSMTNIGLHISLPLNLHFEPRGFSRVTSGISKYIFGGIQSTTTPKTASGIDEVMAVLNCHEESDFFHVLALPLVKVGPMHFVRNPKRRLQLLHTAHISAHIVQEIFIENKSIESFSVGRRHLGFIIPTDSPQKVLHVYPPAFWNAKSGILQGLEHGDRRESWHACLELSVVGFRGNERRMVLVLGLEFRHLGGLALSGEYVRAPWDDMDSVAIPWCNLLDFHRDKSLEQIHRGGMLTPSRQFHGCCEHRGVHIHFNSVYRDSKSASRGGKDSTPFVDVMGEYMCVVDIDLGDFTS